MSFQLVIIMIDGIFHQHTVFWENSLGYFTLKSSVISLPSSQTFKLKDQLYVWTAGDSQSTLIKIIPSQACLWQWISTSFLQSYRTFSVTTFTTCFYSNQFGHLGHLSRKGNSKGQFKTLEINCKLIGKNAMVYDYLAGKHSREYILQNKSTHSFVLSTGKTVRLLQLTGCVWGSPSVTGCIGR